MLRINMDIYWHGYRNVVDVYYKRDTHVLTINLSKSINKLIHLLVYNLKCLYHYKDAREYNSRDPIRSKEGRRNEKWNYQQYQPR